MDMQKPPAKRRKLTDKNVPNAILQSPDFSVDSQMYQDLLNMEKKLDWTMTRKRVEVQDALGKPMTVSPLSRQCANIYSGVGQDNKNTPHLPQSYRIGTVMATRRRPTT